MSDDKKKKIANILEKRWVGNTFALCAAVLLFLLISNLGSVLEKIGMVLGYFAPILYGFVIAYVINPVLKFFEKHVFGEIMSLSGKKDSKKNRKEDSKEDSKELSEEEKKKKEKKEALCHNLSATASLIVVFAFIGVLIGTLIPSIISSVSAIADNFDNYLVTIQTFTEDNAEWFARFDIDLGKIMNSWGELVSMLMGVLAENTEAIIAASSSVGKGATNFALGLILAIYFLYAKEHLRANFNDLRKLVLSDEAYENHNEFFKRCHKILGDYIGYDILDGIIVGGINAILMAIFGMPSIALISVIVGITNLLPTFGPVIGAVMGGFLLLLTNPTHALIFLIFTVIIQTLDGYIIKPRLFGNTLGVPAVWVLIAIVLGGKMFGVVGILLAIPVAAIITFIMKDYIIPALRKRSDRIKSKKNDES